jgi:membrane protein
MDIMEAAARLLRLKPADYRGIRKILLRYGQIGTLVIRDFLDDQCMLRATALAFSSILSLVPFFAFAFAILKGLGVQNALEPVILNNVAAGSHEIVDRVVTYINNTNMTSVGAIGLLTLISTVITLLGTIEDAFNVVWGVKETRPLVRKFSDYLSVVVSAPLLVFAATSITTTLQSQSFVSWIAKTTYLGPVVIAIFRFLPYVSIWIALVFVYIFIPNTRVRFRSALVGGVFAGTLWQVAQWAYINFQMGVSSYNAIYGTLAVLPVFMLWIYVSWLIVLLGVEVAYAHQNLQELTQEDHGKQLCSSSRDILATALMIEICSRFMKGEEAPIASFMAKSFGVPLRCVREVLEELAEAGLLVRTCGGDEGWHPAADPGRIGVVQVLEAVRSYGYPLQFRDVLPVVKAKELLVRETCRDSSVIGTASFKDIVATPASAAV